MFHDVGIKLVPVSYVGEPGSIKISEQLDIISRRESLPCVESSEPGRIKAEYGAGLPVWTGGQHVNHKPPHWLGE